MKLASSYPIPVHSLNDPHQQGVVGHAVKIAVQALVEKAEREYGKEVTVAALSTLRVEVDTSQVSEYVGGTVVFHARMEVS